MPDASARGRVDQLAVAAIIGPQRRATPEREQNIGVQRRVYSYVTEADANIDLLGSKQ